MAVVEEEEQEKRENKKQVFDEAHGSLENLPFDSVMEMEILPRLPLKSILRLELASKPLSPLISDHIRRRYGLPNAASGLFFSWSISKTPTKNFYHALNNNSKFMDDTLATLPRIDEIVGCCNGLLLCQWFNSNRDGFPFVCNPLTGQCASISNSVLRSYDTVLAFDPRVSGHYNILRFRRGMVDVYSSETGSWVEKKQPASHKPYVEDTYPIFFDGKVYFPSRRSSFVKIFDRQGRLVGRIKLPRPAKSFDTRLIGHSGGHLHFAVRVDGEMLVWILEDCDESRWVLKHSVSLRSIFDAGSSTWDHGRNYPRAFHSDMDVVFIQVKDKLFSYNMNNGDLAEVCTPKACWSIFVYSPCYWKDFDL